MVAKNTLFVQPYSVTLLIGNIKKETSLLKGKERDPDPLERKCKHKQYWLYV